MSVPALADPQLEGPLLSTPVGCSKRSFTQRDKLNDKSWDFLFQNPLSESSSKASGMRNPH
jgi:hypothetical protein